MKPYEIVRARLFNQQIADTKFTAPAEIVTSMIAMQAQEFSMAKWAIGLRLKKCTEADVDKAFNEGSILRTHLMRPTWHFVTPTDIRWLLSLTAPRVKAINAGMCRKFGLDKSLLKRSNDILVKAIQRHGQLTRTELQVILAKSNINADGISLSLLMMNAELDGLICSGARKGKQFTYALLDERAPAATIFHREEALAAFTKRYFSSRGPATLKDFVTWSGLTMKDARDGTSFLPAEFIHEKLNDQDYIYLPTNQKNKSRLQNTFLMPDYDEYGMSYKDRSIIFLPSNIPEMSKGGNAGYQHMIVVNGMIGGTWKKIIKNSKTIVETVVFKPLNKTGEDAVRKAVKKFNYFGGMASQDD